MDDLIAKLKIAQSTACAIGRHDFCAALEILIQTARLGLTITDMDLGAAEPLPDFDVTVDEVQGLSWIDLPDSEDWRWN